MVVRKADCYILQYLKYSILREHYYETQSELYIKWIKKDLRFRQHSTAFRVIFNKFKIIKLNFECLKSV
jgi:hypothetical protein